MTTPSDTAVHKPDVQRRYTLTLNRFVVASASLRPMRPGEFYLHDVRVDDAVRCIGLGSSLMRYMVREADKYAATLCLIAKMYFIDGMPDDLLPAWYARFGFEAVPVGTTMHALIAVCSDDDNISGGIAMMRKPNV